MAKQIRDCESQSQEVEALIDEHEWKIIHLNVLGQKQQLKGEQQKTLPVNLGNYEQILSILKKSNQQASTFHQKLSNRSLEELRLDLHQLNSDILRLENELASLKKQYVNNVPKTNDFEEEKQEAFIKKLEKDLEILYQIMDFFYSFSKQKHIGFTQSIGEEFLYSEGASVFEENLNDSQRVFEPTENSNLIELFLDKFHLQHFHETTGIVVEYLDFEEVFVELK